MRAIEFLTEGATDILYHYTNIESALSILASGKFQLTSSMGNPEARYAPPGYPYFLSTTRSRVGNYHQRNLSSAVMFVLDGQWFQQRYPVKPVDFWDRAWLNSGGQTSESEDRVFSRDASVPTGGVMMIHVLLKEQDEYRSPEVRKLLILSKQLGMATYLYDDEQAWRLQDTRKAISVSQAAPLLKGQDPSPRSYGKKHSGLSTWIELIHKKAIGELSKDADRLRYNMQYYSNDRLEFLDFDMSNSKKPGSSDYNQAVAIISYMRANRMTTLQQLFDHVRNKWEAIGEKEQAAKKVQVAKLQQQVDRLSDKWQANGKKEQATKKVSQ
jgi:hypothetical protein